MEYEVDGDGFLLDMYAWNQHFMYDSAKADGVTLTDEMVQYIFSARDYYAENQVVPPIREFAKMHGMDRKAQKLYDLFETGPMKRIAKYGGLPKPTGCV